MIGSGSIHSLQLKGTLMINRLSFPATIAMALSMTLPMACGDDGGDDGGGGAPDADPNVVTTVFRASKMELLDPHPSAIGGFLDVTVTVNDTIKESIEMDGDEPADNVLDLNVSILFHPLDQVGASTPMTISFADCSAPLASTTCTQTSMTTLVTSTATNSSTGTCLDAMPGTTTVYDPPTPVIAVPSPCFQSDAVDVTVNLGTVTLPLKAARISATYSGTPATGLMTGLLTGYVTEADADTILIPEDVIAVGGDPLSSLLADGDMDMGPNGETMGWWFYISVEAQEVTYTVQ
jgi:hypothetical protein